MKVLNFEDSVYKANAIRKVLNQCGVAKIELVSNVEDGLQLQKMQKNRRRQSGRGSS